MKNETTPEIARFEVGETYQDRSACNYDCIYRFKIVSRTKKFVTIEENGETKRRGVYVYNGAEHCKPHGSYSMASIIEAGRDREEENGKTVAENEGARRREAYAAANPETDPFDVEPKSVAAPGPQLEGMGGARPHETPIAFANESAETVVAVLIDAGFSPEALQSFTTERILAEYRAILRRATFAVVAA